MASLRHSLAHLLENPRFAKLRTVFLVLTAILGISSAKMPPAPPPPDFGELVLQHSVFGKDAREEFDQTQRPFTAIGRIELHPDGVQPSKYRGNIPICTGALVWHDLVVTNAHCVIDASTNEVTRKKIWFRPGYQRGKASPETRAVNVWLGSKTPNKKRAEDWAILQLEHPIGKEYGWLNVKELPDENYQLEAGYQSGFIAYASDFASGGLASRQFGCGITAYDTYSSYFRHNCHMNSGSSGGPLFVMKDQDAFIVAINAAHTGRALNSYFTEFTPNVTNIAVSASRFLPTLQKLKGELMPIVEVPPPGLATDKSSTSAVRAKAAPAN